MMSNCCSLSTLYAINDIGCRVEVKNRFMANFLDNQDEWLIVYFSRFLRKQTAFQITDYCMAAVVSFPCELYSSSSFVTERPIFGCFFFFF